jgi:hypothetical protein
MWRQSALGLANLVMQLIYGFITFTQAVEAQQKEDILGMKNFLTRFVSKIEVGYKTAHMYYTYPIDDLTHLNSNGQLWGHLYKRDENRRDDRRFSFIPCGAKHDKN